jgi:AraC-like DNA-binding protein
MQVQTAARLLEETDLPLKTIAARCGIAHMEYLSYLFKKSFGQSPGAFRRMRSEANRSLE